MSDLAQKVIKKTGLDKNKAHAGIGAILSFLSKQLDPSTFSKLTDKIPDYQVYMDAFAASDSETEGDELTSLFNSFAQNMGIKSDSIQSLAGLVGNLKKAGIDFLSLPQFIPAITEFMEEKGLGDIAKKIKESLKL